MFIGHYGAGFAGKKIDSTPSLGTMFLAAQFLDLIWPVFILLGIEKVRITPGISAANPLDFTYYPYSHSLVMVLIWSLMFALIYYYFRKNIRGSVLLGILVLSHWILDLLVHIPDLPIFPGSGTKVGLGLWNSVVFSVVLEAVVFSAGVYLYMISTVPKNKKGTYSFWGLVLFLFIIYFLNVFGSPPPSVEAIGYAGLLQWMFIPWAYWIDRNRSTTLVKTLPVAG